MEVVKKWISRQSSRPVLQYAQHTAEGDIVATDSHRLIAI